MFRIILLRHPQGLATTFVKN